uniref:Galectin n=1 Tax=Strongyloides stercoralis TaxID=6248 RepID=A0A0K0ECK4_STRER
MEPTAPIEATYDHIPKESYSIQPRDYFFPTVKFATALNGYRFPMHVRIIGKCPEKGDRFEVNFVTNKDVAFHFNPRFKEKVVVRNNTIDGKWQHEERTPKGNPFKKEKVFILDFYAQQTHVIAKLDNIEIASFAFRSSPSSIVGLEIQGEIELYLVTISNI